MKILFILTFTVFFTASFLSNGLGSLADEVIINDPQPQSAGIYIRFSEKLADYITELAAEGLPALLTKIVLPTIDIATVKGENFVITEFEKPIIDTTFINGTGVSFKLHLPLVEVEGDFTLGLLFIRKSHMLAVMKNWTIIMDVNIERKIGDNKNTINVIRCEGSVPIRIRFFGGSAISINPFTNFIGSQIESAIKDKICLIPGMLNAFLAQKQEEILSEEFWKNRIVEEQTGPQIVEHICSDILGPIETEEDYNEEPNSTSNEELMNESDELGKKIKDIGVFAPDLTLRYPPTFSDKDVIIGIDAGIVLNGNRAKEVERPKFHNVPVIRDQMIGLIISEYVPNTILSHIFDKSLGSFNESISLKDVPKSLGSSLARLICSSDCMIIIKANLTQKPHISIDDNGIMLHIELEVDADFYRKNKTHELLKAGGAMKVLLKPYFKNNRIYIDIKLDGMDFKINKIGISSMFSSSARKLLNFIIPNKIWPKIEKFLRSAINRNGIKLPTVCGIHLENLHLDYIHHAAIFSTDFTMDLPFFVDSFKDFVEADLMLTEELYEYDRKIRYL